MPTQQMLLVGGKPAERTYVDETFKINTYIGNGVSGSGTRTITHGLKYGDDPGMVISKQIENNYGSYRDWYVYSGSTWNGGSHKTNAGTYADYAHTGGSLSATNNTYQVTGTGFKHNANDKKYVSYMFKKTPGFFTHKQYTGTGSTQTLSHDLGAVPGMIWVHRTNQFNTTNWAVYHKGQNKGVDPEDYRLILNTNTTENNDTYWGDTAPTSTQFTVGDSHNEVNANGDTYTAYFFAGGPSSATGAASLPWDGSSDRLNCGTTSNKTADFNFGSGDLTIECWIKASETQPDKPHILCIGDDDDQGEVDFQWDHEDYANKITFWSRNKGSTPFLTSETHYFNGDELWHHVAVTRASNVWRLFVDGKQEASTTWTGDTTDENEYLTIGNTTTGIQQSNVGYFNGRISNLRIVKGTAVYTSSFHTPLEPLTNITNTKLLCCNDASSKTGATVTPITLTEANISPPNTTSPFDDPLGQIFGKSGDKPIIKCGNYRVNGDTTNGTRVYLGFEPQWVMIKSTGFTEEWHVFDVLRGITSDADNRLELSQPGQQLTGTTFLSIDASGFTALHNPNINKDNEDFIYMAIRRADGYVGKPVETATNVFTMDTGNSSSTIPCFDSAFDVDFALITKPAATLSNYVAARLMQGKELITDSTGGEGAASNNTFDSNAGWRKGGADSTFQSWMWKRHAGFDVVSIKPPSTGSFIPHSLGKIPEMIWCKPKQSSTQWSIYHKGLNGGTNPEQYRLKFTDDPEGATSGHLNDTAPTDLGFTVGSFHNNTDSLFVLFASVAGISKCGEYSGSSSTVTVNCGFVPRLVIQKKLDNAGSPNGWLIFDTLRGIADGSDCYMFLSSSAADVCSYDVLDLVDSGGVKGFSVPTTGSNNDNGSTYIYYAHA